MKHIDIPFIPELSQTPISEIANLLEDRGTRNSIEELNWPKQFPYRPLTTFTIGHDGTTLWIDFFTRCNFLRAVNSENQSPVSQDSCVEFFVAPHPDQPRYWNFEFNCIGTVNASTRIERPNPRRLTDQEIDRIHRLASCGTRPFNELEGLFAWNLLVGIPLDLFDIKYEGRPIDMLGNFYKCASACSQPHFLSWNPINTERPDFHQPAFFGKITIL